MVSPESKFAIMSPSWVLFVFGGGKEINDALFALLLNHTTRSPG